jgi:hypothetical protein
MTKTFETKTKQESVIRRGDHVGEKRRGYRLVDTCGNCCLAILKSAPFLERAWNMAKIPQRLPSVSWMAVCAASFTWNRTPRVTAAAS